MKREKGMTLLNYYYCYYYYYISTLLLLFPRCKKRSKNFLYDIDQIFIQQSKLTKSKCIHMCHCQSRENISLQLSLIVSVRYPLNWPLCPFFHKAKHVLCQSIKLIQVPFQYDTIIDMLKQILLVSFNHHRSRTSHSIHIVTNSTVRFSFKQASL